MMSKRRTLFAIGVLLPMLVLFTTSTAFAQPDPPEQGTVTATAAGFDRISVGWTQATGGDDETHFDVLYEQLDTGVAILGVASMTKIVGADTFRTVLTGLTPGKRYLVAVRARDAGPTPDTASAFEEAAAPAITFGAPTPDVMAAPMVTGDDMMLMVSWAAGEGNGVAIKAYDVQYKESSKTTWVQHDPDPTGMSTVIANLENGMEYDVQVRALNGSEPDKADWSATTKGMPTADPGTTDPGTTDPGTTDPGTTDDDGVAEGAPEKVVLRTAAATSTTITISWEPPGSGMTRLVDYQLEYEAAGQGEFTNNITPEQVSVQSWSIPNLKPATSYMIRLRAQNRVQGYGPWSEYQTVTTPAAATTPPGEETVVGAPEKVVLRTSSAKSTTTTISIYWDVPGSGKSRLVDYQVRYGLAAGGDSGLLTNNVDVTATSPVSHIIEGLTAGTAYSYRVRAQNLQGYGPWSDAHAISTMATPGAPPAGPGISKMAEPMVEAGDMMLMVSWAEPASHKSITHYLVDYKTASATKWMAKAMNVTAMEYTIDGLINGTAYLVRVRAVDSAGAMGEWSDSGSGTPMAMEEPEEPTPTPALPIFGALALGAGLVAAGRRRLRRRELRAGRVQQQITR